MAFQFTESQRQAIEERGSSLLVSAAAGSGKTRVLTERLMRYVTDPEDPRDIDSFLVITYTRAAAAELRSRILGELGERAAQAPLDKRLRRQQNLCYRAQIGTIHSFCTDVLRENCHHLGLSPAFRVMDEDRARQMKQSVLDKVLEARYEQIESDAAFRLLADTVCAGRDDAPLAQIVLDLYEKLRSHPYPGDWAAGQMDALELRGVTDAADTVWGRELLEGVRASAAFWARAMEDAAGEIGRAGEKIRKAYAESFAVTLEALRDFQRALDQGWDKARSFLPLPFPRLGSLRSDPDKELAERVKAVRAGCKDAQEAWQKALGGSSERLLADQRATAPAMRALLELVLDFDKAFSAEKRRQNQLDFSDLEHFAAQLLVDKASGEPTWIAWELSSRYTEIMVDEYQDVNAVQEMIFRAVSRGGRNLFMVGDVKQSIYRFRLADLSIFMDKYRRYPDISQDCGQAEGRRILLKENFRSRRCVLDAANHVFSNLMSEALGELDYDQDAALNYGALGYDTADDRPVELNILDPLGGGDADEETPQKLELEARFVARRIREMVAAGETVTTGEGKRPCTYADFAVLLRSPGSGGSVFHRVLAEAGIPVCSRQGGGFFTSLEVTVVMNLLAVLDNPHADVPLISVLRSPAFGFTPDELSAIRAGSRQTDYYTALCAAAEGGDEKCAAFLSLLRSLRRMAADLSVSELLWRLYNETGLLTLCLAMSEGENRRDKLMLLLEYARRFESGGQHGLFRFAAWLRRLAEQGEEPAMGGGEDAVKILSIHKSKGLEFPFVFLCDLSHRFNSSDSSAPVLMHSQLGLGPQFIDLERGIRYPTLARQAVARRISTEMLSEEMRVLYVGMTRARERLFLTGTWKNAEAGLDKLRPTLSSPLAPEVLRGASSPLRWLAAAALLPGAGPLIRLSILHEEDAVPAPPAAESVPPADSAAELEALRSRLDFVYPYAAAVELPSKLTATGLKGRLDDEDRLREAASLAGEPRAEDFRRPRLGQPAALSPAQRGTATHTLLQYMDLTQAADSAGVRRELARLSAQGFLSPEQAEAVDIAAVMRFGTSALCRRILASGEWRREFRFTLLVDAADYFDVPAGERALLQGVIDCYFVEDGQITIVDYKTDRITAEELPQRAAGYAPQLRTYAKALERIRGLPVKECLLCFLRLGACVPVEIP